MKVVDQEQEESKAKGLAGAPIKAESKLVHIGAERAYVAAILNKNELIETAMEDDLDMISSKEYRALVSGVFELYDRGWTDISKETIGNLADRLPDVADVLMKMGGIDFLNRTCSYEMSLVNFAKTRETLKELHSKRKLVDGLKKQAMAIEAMAERDDVTTTELVQQAEITMSEVGARVYSKPSFKIVSHDPDEYIQRHEREVLEGKTVKGVMSNMPAYDEMAGGFGNGRLHVFGAPTGCHRKGQLILMFDGALKAVEDIMVGDFLMGPDSTPRRVMSLHRGNQEMAQIIPVKGDSWVVNLDHVLTLVGIESAKPSNRTPGNKGELIDVTVRDWLGWSKWRKHVHKLFRTGVDFAFVQDLPIEPYLLGALLGDGHFGSPAQITSADHEVHAAMEIAADRWGLTVTIKNEGTTRETSSLTDERARWNNANVLTKEIRDLGLYKVTGGDKFIPDAYKVAGRHQRLDLLAGLMDTDGSLHGTGYDFISKSETLSNDVAFVARSLGFAAYVKPCQKSCQTGAIGTYYRVSIDGDCSEIPLRIARKRAQSRKQIKDVLHTGFSVEILPAEDYYGFTVDVDHRYLLGDFTVTHNCGKSLLSVNWELSAAYGLDRENRDVRVGVIDTGELMYEQDWESRFLACLSGVPTKMIQKRTYLKNPGFKQDVWDAWAFTQKHKNVLWEQMADFDGPQVYAFIKRWVKREGVNIIFFDNIKVNAQWGGGKDVYNKIGDLSNYLKNAAVDLDIPVVSFIQLTSDATITGRAKLGMKRPHISMFAGGQRTLHNTDVGGVMDWEDAEDWANHNRLLYLQKSRNDRTHRRDECMVLHGDMRRARLTVAENRLDGPLDFDDDGPLVATTVVEHEVREPDDIREAYQAGLEEVIVDPTPKRRIPSFSKARQAS